ncbi:MAG: hypothetical protein JWQ62_1832 [Lacunisphaera sp.]|nr:hypothetical protein [Lacunisphaera sp.]
MRKISGIIFLCGLLWAGPLWALQGSDLGIVINRVPVAAPVKPAVQISAGANGSSYVEVALTNASGQDVALTMIEVTLPWLANPDPRLLVSSGGTTMATWPMQVIDPAAPRDKPPHSGTYLLARHDGKYSLVAFLSWNTFWSKIQYVKGRVVMTADGEGRILKAGETVQLEKLWFIEGPDWQDLLFGYADEIARQLHIKLKPQPAYVGWSTWDYYGRKWTATDVAANSAALTKLEPKANLVQIDGGWWPHRGDFRQVRDNLKPGGMKELAAQIRASGLVAGIHFDGMRGDMSSTILKEHPEYFLKDGTGAIINVPQLNDGDHLAHTYFDFSEPGAVAYMRDVARNIRRNWGYDYLKIDFLVDGINAVIRKAAFQDDPARLIVPHNPGLTSVERLHLALTAWREGMGDDAYFLGCSAPFGQVFGHVDGLRTGYDISPHMKGVRMCAEATAGMFFLQGKVVYNDADYQVARAKEDEDDTLVHNPDKRGQLTRNEAEMWANYVGLFGGTKLNSDNLSTLRPERQELFRQAVALPACRRFIPLDYWEHGRDREDAFHVMLGEAGDGTVYLAVFNWSDQARTYSFTGVRGGKSSPRPALPGVIDEAFEAGGLQLHLEGRHSVVYRLSPGLHFDEVRRALRFE